MTPKNDSPAAGAELNGTISALNLNMEKMVSPQKDSIGMILSKREGLCLPDGLRLIGLKPINPNNQLFSGSHLFNENENRLPENDLGYVTSSCYSPTLKSFIALAFLKNGTRRYGQKINVSNPILKNETVAEICNPIFVDPNGDRLRG